MIDKEEIRRIARMRPINTTSEALVSTTDFEAVLRPSEDSKRNYATVIAIRNKVTGLVEAEGRDLAAAVRAVYAYQDDLDETLANPRKRRQTQFGGMPIIIQSADAEDDDDPETGYN